jgi:LuxR family maltose regulon positive regulatory protein
MHEVLGRIEKLMGSEPPNCVSSRCIQGEVDVLRGYQRYTESEGDLAVERAEQALARLPSDSLSQRGFAVVLLAVAHQMVGDLGQARQVAYDALAHDPTPSRSSYHARLLFSLCFVDWMAADLLSLKRTATHCLEMSDEFGLQESSAIGRYFVGIAHYQQHELAAAEASLLPVVTGPIMSNMEYFAQIAFALAFVYEARGQSGKATATAEFIGDHMLKIRNPDQLALAQAFQAELALRQGCLAEAIKWAAQFDPEPFVPMHLFYAPRMTFAKVLIAQGSEESHDRADDLLTRLEAYLAKIHNTRFLIEVLALQALLRAARGEEPAALDVLGRAVSLAQPGGAVRLFVDLGPRIPRLLNRLALDEEGQRYVQRIRSACRDDELARTGQARTGRSSEHAVPIEVSASSPSLLSPPLLSPLTKREFEILGMLAMRLSNKEIADQLYIASATVKRHAESIYGKLGVCSRREAVAKAKEFGILGTG